MRKNVFSRLSVSLWVDKSSYSSVCTCFRFRPLEQNKAARRASHASVSVYIEICRPSRPQLFGLNPIVLLINQHVDTNCSYSSHQQRQQQQQQHYHRQERCLVQRIRLRSWPGRAHPLAQSTQPRTDQRETRSGCREVSHHLRRRELSAGSNQSNLSSPIIRSLSFDVFLFV